MSRAEVDLQLSVKKACSPDESAPKRKHVRACIVYTWDHKNSGAFWNALKVQPLQADEVQLFKALFVAHKVLQEGHPSTLKDGFKNKDWLEGLSRMYHGEGARGYGRLIREYNHYLVRKLEFHRSHPGFNGMFEYEEYISLRTVNDPNEGYEAILDLMNLQDMIDDLQKLIFASISHSRSNECRISGLVPLVGESYGIYKFITSMMRGIYSQIGSADVLAPLVERFDQQHDMLREFYSDCQSIKYLTSLITIPRLNSQPPNLLVEDNGDLPIRPKSVETENSTPQISSQPTAASAVAPPPQDSVFPQPTGMDFFQNSQQQYELDQARLEQDRQQQILQQQQYQAQQQALFEEQQRQQAAAAQQAQQDLMNRQLQAQTQGRVGELERDLLGFKNQYDNDQLLLEQYDQRVKSLEYELQNLNQSATQQLESKNDLIENLQEQISVWKNKYEALAKLYSQLRTEHLNLLQKFKKIQQKVSSAQEAIEKKEKFEKDLRSKNIELADLIRERDRARLDLDRLKGGKNNEIEKLEAELRLLKDKLEATERSQSSNLSTIFEQHKKELDSLQNQLSDRDLILANTSPESNQLLNEKLREKDEELEIMQETMDSALRELALSQKETDTALDEQIDMVLLENLSKLTSLIDTILENNVKRIQDASYELESPMQAGNQNSTPEFFLSIIEKASSSGTEFATAFNDFIAEGPNGDHSSIIKTSSDFTSSVADIVLNAKGITRLSSNETDSEILLATTRDVLNSSESFFVGLFSTSLKDLSEDDKFDKVIAANFDVQEILQELVTLTEKLVPKSTSVAKSGNLGDLVDSEMANAAAAISAASDHLNQLLSRPMDPTLSSIDLEVNRAILAAAIAVTNAIALLIKAATESQQEIVAQGKGSSSRAAFYKKNNRWTEGLVSASKSVAASTNILIQTADGVLSQKNSHEQLIVASNEVAASTAQLVAASRVKATFMSKTQDNLEVASKAVTSACKMLVSKVQELIAKKDEGDDIDFSKLTSHENKTVEMEQQVEILKLENSLNAARKRLGEIRKFGYRDDSDEE